jgi:polar amino acid transport system substrate-binding protein
MPASSRGPTRPWRTTTWRNTRRENRSVFFYYFAPYGIGFGSDEKGKQMAHAVQAALLELQKDGVYASLMKKCGLLDRDGRPTFPINDGKL